MSQHEENIRQFYAEEFRKHHENVVKASSQGLELWELLESQEDVDIIMEYFLNVSDLGWTRASQNREDVPANIVAAYDFYTEHSDDQVTVSRVLVQDSMTYAVKVKTDGDNGWLEVFDENGVLLGAALTWVDVIGWEKQEVIREKFKTKEVYDDLRKLQQLSVCYPPETS